MIYTETAYFEQFAGDTQRDYSFYGERTAIEVMRDLDLWLAIATEQPIRIMSKINPREITNISKHPSYPNSLIVSYRSHFSSEVDPLFPIIVERRP